MLLLVALSAALIGPISAQLQPLQSPLTSQQRQLLQLVEDLQRQLAQQQRVLQDQQRQLQQFLQPQPEQPQPEQPQPDPGPGLRVVASDADTLSNTLSNPPMESSRQRPLRPQRPSRPSSGPSRPRPQAQQPNQTESGPQFLDPGVGRWLLTTDQACLPCICEAASGCDETLACDERGFCGPFLLSKRYWDLAGRPLLRGDSASRPGADADCLRDSFCAAEAVRGYLDRFAQDCDGDRRVDCFDLARVHFQGPFNCRAPLKPPSDFSETFRRCWEASRRSNNIVSTSTR